MTIADWDNEIAVVAREIDMVRAAHERTRVTGNRALVARKIVVIQTQLNLERTYERLAKLTQREHLLLPREKTLMHWGQIFLDRAQKLYALKSKLLIRSLWLKLVASRLAGTEARPGADIDAEDVVSLTVRQATLAKTERYLSDALVKLRERRDELEERFALLHIADANRAAAASLFGRLGRTPTDAAGSPTVKALGRMVKDAAAPVTATAAVTRRAEAEAKLERRTAGLLGTCRGLVANRLRNPETPIHPKVKDRFDLVMRQLDDLEDETRQAYAQILETRPPAAHPILVQKPDKHAKTVPSD